MGISGELQRGRWGELAQGASALSTRPSERQYWESNTQLLRGSLETEAP